MANSLVNQLRFARAEFVRGLEAVSAEEGVRRFESINSLSWIIGHLANQEHFYWNFMGQGLPTARDLNKLVGTGTPATTPPLDEMWAVWKETTQTADPYLDSITDDILKTHLTFGSRTWREDVGTLLQRNTFHYWFHLGEGMAIRQLLGHTDLPQFVGDMSALHPDAE